jgi:hypothetical protein
VRPNTKTKRGIDQVRITIIETLTRAIHLEDASGRLLIRTPSSIARSYFAT